MGERPAEDSTVRNRVGGLDMTGPFAGSNPALGTMKDACVPDTPICEVLGHPFYVDKLGKDPRWKELLEKLGLKPSKA